MTVFAGERLDRGEPMTGLVLLPQVEAVGPMIDALEELLLENEPESLRDCILYLRP